MMNDIRRSILWIIFAFSLILLWDQWQIHNGRKATFFPTSTPPAATASAPAGSASAVAGTAVAGAAGAAAPAGAVAG